MRTNVASSGHLLPDSGAKVRLLNPAKGLVLFEILARDQGDLQPTERRPPAVQGSGGGLARACAPRADGWNGLRSTRKWGQRAGMMGARVTRVFKNFNLESRAHREIGKAKPTAAPRHPVAATQAYPDQFQEEIKKKDEHLHALLKEVYVDSRDPLVKVKNSRGSLPSKTEERRLAKAGQLGHLDVKTIPKGKISVIEALTLLSNHHRSPDEWTVETIANEYSLELKDVTALLTYFIPFSVEIFPPQDKKSIQPR